MTLLSYTGYECNVIRFYSDLKSMEKTPVVTAVTAYYDYLWGTTVMLVFNQALWIGRNMGKSLIATIQV